MTTAIQPIPSASITPAIEHGVNGISLGVHEVFSAAEQRDYLAKRFARWNVGGPPGLEPHLRELPPVHQGSALRLSPAAKITETELSDFRDCARSAMDHYFPPIGNETVIEDTLTFTKEVYHTYPPGTAVVIRRTTNAELFFINPSVQVEADGSVVTNIRTAGSWAPLLLFAASPIDEAKIVTKIYGMFASLLPGPAGSVAKAGLELVNMILGMAGSNGPSWSEITAMMRAMVREELVTNDLEYVQADYESVKKWADIQYLPNRSHKSKDELWNMLRPQIDLVSRDINLLLQTNHRIAGFGLLLLGVDTYLGLLQEQIMLGYDADIRKAGDQWATSMLKVWEEVQKDRHAQIVFNKYSYGVYVPPGDVITCEYWCWTDKKTKESRGDRNGPWQVGGKPDRSETDCRANAEGRYRNIVLPNMIQTFGDPETTAKAWRTVRHPG
jgi:hypothetical protein